MFDLHVILQEWSPSQRREILYYLVRYFKQFLFLEENGKDVFKDVFDDLLNDEVRTATIKAISVIETEIGQKASELDVATADKILDRLTEIEWTIGNDFTDEELDKASAFLKPDDPIPF